MEEKRFEFIKRPSDALKYVDVAAYRLRFVDLDDKERKNMDFYNFDAVDQPLEFAMVGNQAVGVIGYLTVRNDFETDDEEATEALQKGLVKDFGKKYLNALGNNKKVAHATF